MGFSTYSPSTQAQLGEIDANTDGIELLLDTIKTQTDNLETPLARIAGDSTIIATLSDPHVAFADTDIDALPTHVANAVLLAGVKADGSPNSAPVQYGFNATNLRFSIAPGGSVGIDAPLGKKIDTANIWVRGAIGDGICVGLMD